MKKIIPEFTFGEEEQKSVRSLSQETKYTEEVVRILYARGIRTADGIKKFMHPSKEHFLNPFLLKGMKEAVELITLAKDEGRTVAVFGDYDADGVCASAILYHALKEFGIEAHVYIPERQGGYGLSVEGIDKIFDECQPELFITVDCGISCAKEAQYIYELGADVIITDHHELPEVLPDCILVNPKLGGEYPYDNLCGAGVAFKLACALIGTKAYELLDFAALATVADSVPLVDENRDIVAEGLKLFNGGNVRPCFRVLLSKADSVSAQTIAFNLAPRINAAGRMGDAYAAYRLFVSESAQEMYDLSVKLTAYNTERQRCCDELYLAAKNMLKAKGAYGNVIMLAGENWNAGFVGIVAARLAEEFNRPTILFVRSGDKMKGSARSIESVNIFQALKACQEYITEFGGHAQAAGINIDADKFDDLERALDEEIGKRYSPSDFIPSLVVAEELDKPLTERLAGELQKMEPYGVGFKKPLFYITAYRSLVRPLKVMSPHLTVRNELIDLTYFGGIRQKKILESDVEKKIVFEVDTSFFKGKKYIKGIVKEVVYDGTTGSDADFAAFGYALSGLGKRGKENVEERGNDLSETIIEYLTKEETERLISEKTKECAFGLCMIASERKTVDNYPVLQGKELDLFYPSSRSLYNLLLLSPAPEADLSGYREYIFLDQPIDLNYPFTKGKKVYVCKEFDGRNSFKRLDCSREGLLEVFSLLRTNVGSLYGESAEELTENCDALGIDKKEFLFALQVFSELGLVAFENSRLTVYRGVKTELSASEIFNKVASLDEGD